MSEYLARRRLAAEAELEYFMNGKRLEFATASWHIAGGSAASNVKLLKGLAELLHKCAAKHTAISQ